MTVLASSLRTFERQVLVGKQWVVIVIVVAHCGTAVAHQSVKSFLMSYLRNEASFSTEHSSASPSHDQRSNLTLHVEERTNLVITLTLNVYNTGKDLSF